MSRIIDYLDEDTLDVASLSGLGCDDDEGLGRKRLSMLAMSRLQRAAEGGKINSNSIKELKKPESVAIYNAYALKKGLPLIPVGAPDAASPTPFTVPQFQPAPAPMPSFSPAPPSFSIAPPPVYPDPYFAPAHLPPVPVFYQDPNPFAPQFAPQPPVFAPAAPQLSPYEIYGSADALSVDLSTSGYDDYGYDDPYGYGLVGFYYDEDDAELAGIGSFFKKIFKPVAKIAAGFIPVVGPVIAGLIDKQKTPAPQTVYVPAPTAPAAPAAPQQQAFTISKEMLIAGGILAVALILTRR